MFYFYFFFNDTATTEIYTLSLHDALPIFPDPRVDGLFVADVPRSRVSDRVEAVPIDAQEPAALIDERSEEHTSELQSQSNLVCRLLLEKKKNVNAAVPMAVRLCRLTDSLL